MLQIMKVPENLINLYIRPEFDPTYNFSFKEDFKKLEFLETMPKLGNKHDYVAQKIVLGEEVFKRAGVEDESAFSDVVESGPPGFYQSWKLLEPNKLQHNLKCPGTFSVVTEFTAEGHLLFGTSTSECGTKSFIIFEKT